MQENLLIDINEVIIDKDSRSDDLCDA